MSFDLTAFFNNMDVSINSVDQTLLNTYNNLDRSINDGTGFDGNAATTLYPPSVNFDTGILETTFPNTDFNNLFNDVSINQLDTSHNEMLGLINNYDASRNRVIEKDRAYQHIINQLENGKSNTHYLFMIIWMVIIAIVASSVFLAVIENGKISNPIVYVIMVIFVLYVLYRFIQIAYYYVQGYSANILI